MVADFAGQNKGHSRARCYNSGVRKQRGDVLVKLLLIAGGALLMASGCSALAGPDVPATLQAENMGFVAEATQIAQAGAADRALIAATAAAAETRVAELQGVNAVLLATVRAGDPLEQGVSVVAQTGSRPASVAEGQRWFVRTGTASSVRESDGCVVDPQVRFPADVERIYATVHGYNVGAGVVMSVEWLYEGTPVWQESWPLARSWADICMWFYIDPTTVDFRPGNWSVRLFADGFQLEEALIFTIENPTAAGGG